MAITLIIIESCQPLTQLMYGWSKYGGGNFGLVQESIDSEWACQTCGSRSTEPPYLFEYSPREFMKICYFCNQFKDAYNIKTFPELIELVRSKHDLLEYLSGDNA